MLREFHLADVLTLGNAACGLAAVFFAMHYMGSGSPTHFFAATTLAPAALLFDWLDGRVARWRHQQSVLGRELDSLADIINFGVAPALVLYVFILDRVGSIGWIAALIYAIAAGLRLARFNVMAEREYKAKWQSEFFVGVPAPMGALLVLLPVYLGFLGLESDRTVAYGATAYTVLIGYLLVSRLPVWSGKSETRVRRDLMLPLLLGVVLYVALLMSYTWQVLVVTTIAYLCILPFSARAWKKRYGTLTIEDDHANV